MFFQAKEVDTKGPLYVVQLHYYKVSGLGTTNYGNRSQETGAGGGWQG